MTGGSAEYNAYCPNLQCLVESQVPHDVYCPICTKATRLLGTQTGKLDGRDFNVRQCPSCHYSYIENFRSDFENIYNEEYYQGRGADPLINYVNELENFDTTIRNYEWNGVVKIFQKLAPKGGRWLDFGCGVGGLVRFARSCGIDAIGHEDGWAANLGKSYGIPILSSSELADYQEKFDFVSAIEVLEHIPNPLKDIGQIRKLLKPGGVLFVTTGNAQPWRDRLLHWSYTRCPDVHASFYEPSTLRTCFGLAGFDSKDHNFCSGFVEIIKFKILKTLRVKEVHFLIDLLPWNLLSRVVDRRHQVTRQPYGVAI